ncbi:MAG TPA: YbaB/EbfC family nucleoid-associated protein [Candidatus Polarisedimenticolaceae bacterium]|nr:YbaB/EbfC family nucleoid-associated protein [Candidatus Polarisedimenticolaceae bacterium]
MNIQKMMKDLQRMQTQLQSEIETLELEAGAGGGLVTARMNGRKELVGLTIAPEAITPDDPGLLQDLVLAAVNEVGRLVDAEIQRKTQGLAGGLKLPGLS